MLQARRKSGHVRGMHRKCCFRYFEKVVKVVPGTSFSQVIYVELGLMCTDEKDNEELTKMCGPLCWQGYDKDLGGTKKIMWRGIKK